MDEHGNRSLHNCFGALEHHTDKNITNKVVKIAKAFSVDEKVSAIVHDQACNMESSLRILCSDKRWQSPCCNAHHLQLYLKAALSGNVTARMLGAARKLVGHFKHSVVALEKLKKRQTQMEINQKNSFKTAQLAGTQLSTFWSAC